MDKYEIFMKELVDSIQGTWLSRNRRITGNTIDEIEQAEKVIGKKLPASLKAWYLQAGKIPPYFNDHDADYSLRDLQAAQETARSLVETDTTGWKIDEYILPFSQRIGDQFLFVDTRNNIDDPPVYHHMEEPRFVSPAFTAYIRETLLQWINHFS